MPTKIVEVRYGSGACAPAHGFAFVASACARMHDQVGADSHGEPDGMTIDAEGCLCVAMWGGAAVHRYSPQGHLDAVVDVPASQVSSCAFGGPTLDELDITTSREGRGEREPQAGAFFMSHAGVRGVPVHEYTG